MNAWIRLLNEPVVERFGWVLIHFLWEGAAIGIVMAGAMLVLRRASAQVRYAVLCAGLLACAGTPLVTWVAMARKPVAVSEAKKVVANPGLTPASSANANIPDSPATHLATSPAPSTFVGAPVITTAPTPRRAAVMRALDRVAPYAASLWLVGVVVLTLRLAGAWLQLRRLRRSGTAIADSAWEERLRALALRMGVNKAICLFNSALVEVPTLIGWLRPMILLPASAFTGLAPEQLEAILAHELAHVRRCDYLVNLLQTVIETTLFYHPAVWWMSRRLREERENCCDDMAVAAIRDRAVYAGALAALEESRGTPPPRAAMAAARGSLLERIRRIAGAEGGRISLAPIVAAALIVGSLLAPVCGRLASGKDSKPASGGDRTQDSALEKQIVDAARNDDAGTLEKLLRDKSVDVKKVSSDHFLLGFAKSVKVEEMLIEHGADPNALSSPGESPLLHLCWTGAPIELVRVLLKHGANPNFTLDSKETPLMFAKDAKTVDALVEYGADLHAKDEWGLGVLEKSGRNGNMDAFLAIIGHGVAFDAKDMGPAILVSAACNNDLRMAEWLLAHGVDPDAPASVDEGQKALFYYTTMPLGFAALNDHKEMIDLLLKHGADGNKAINYTLGCLNNETKIVKALWEHGIRGNVPELCYAVSQGALVEELQGLLDKGAAINAGKGERSPLLQAAQLGRLDIVEFLVSHGADTTDNAPLTSAAEEVHVDIVDYLLKHGMKPDRWTMQYAVMHVGTREDPEGSERAEPIIKMLIRAGGLKTLTPTQAGLVLSQGLDVSDGVGGDVAIVKMLLDGGLSPELPLGNGTVISRFRDQIKGGGYEHYEGQNKALLDLLEKADAALPHNSDAPAAATPAHGAVKADLTRALGMAARKGGAALVEQLLEEGADPNVVAQGADGNALYLAASNNHTDVVAVLLKHGANPNSNWPGERQPSLCSVMVLQGRVDIAHLLHDAGAKVSPEAWAGTNGDIPALKALAAKGVFKHNTGGAMESAVAAGQLDAVKYLESLGDKSHVAGWLPYAAGAGRTGIMEYLFSEGGVDLDIEDAALMAAVRQDQHEALKVLLAHGANANYQGPRMEGMIPASIFSAVKSGAVMKLLLDAGADPDFNASPDEALSHAPDAESVRLLIQHGVDPKAKAGVIELAVLLDRPAEVIDAMITAGVKFDPKGNGIAALCLASARNNVELMDDLLRRGVDPNGFRIENIPHGGFTAIGLATRNNSTDAVRLLLAHGANAAGDSREERSPLGWAEKNGRPDIADMLRESGRDNRQGNAGAQ